jgi:hypothetical protein
MVVLVGDGEGVSNVGMLSGPKGRRWLAGRKVGAGVVFSYRSAIWAQRRQSRVQTVVHTV